MCKWDGIARQHSFYFTPWIVFLWHREFYLLISRLETARMYWIYHHVGRREFSLDLYKCKSTWILLLLDELQLLSFPRVGLLTAAQLPEGLGCLWDVQGEAISWIGGSSRVLRFFLESAIFKAWFFYYSSYFFPPASSHPVQTLPEAQQVIQTVSSEIWLSHGFFTKRMMANSTYCWTSQQNVASSTLWCWAFPTSVSLWLWELAGGCFRASLTIYAFNSIHLSHLQY